ncbi:P-type conjugative transfer protein TrbG (fragment) [Candidatus Glomeribacter gigasporarum BEG34]|uniref:P-type conjugative transfer protein TrbG n=2 Tax=Candidatus Glomeribacter gigasporarum TaxID=132144 RepID=G2J8A6_9BURK
MAIWIWLVASAPARADRQRFLTQRDAVAAQAEAWRQNGIAKPILSDDGRILYPYGQTMPKLICTLLRACDIQLEPGERLTGKPVAGDTVRWLMSKQVSGTGAQAVTHIIVKPTDVNIDTNLIITTDRRTYQIALYSSPNKKSYLHAIGWYYPEDVAQQWDESASIEAERQRARERLVAATLSAGSIEKLDFSYAISGDAKVHFKPVRVYNNGEKVYIQLPEAVKTGEAPVLFLLGPDNRPQIANYRVKTPTLYEVDKLFERAVLVVGTGGEEQKVSIRWTKNERAFQWPWSRGH